MAAPPDRGPILGQATERAEDRVAVPLRIAVFSDVLPGRSGVATYYDDFCEHLEERVERLVIVTPANDRHSFPWSVPLPGDRTQRLCFPPFRAIGRTIARLRPDVVMCATPGPYGALGAALARRSGAALCVGLHTRFDDLAGLYWNRLVGVPLQRALRLWEGQLFRRAAVVLVNNDELLAWAESRGISNVRLVGTAAPKDFLESPPARTRELLTSVAFIGRLAPEKRLDEILDAAERLPDIRFRIAGDGPLRSKVDRCSDERTNVESLGWVGREEVADLIDDTDLLLLPSRYETFGTIALEALARGRPALVSRHCGISRWPGVAQGLFSIRQDESLVEAIGRVRNLGPEARRAKALRGREAAEALTQRTIEDWLGVLEDASRAGEMR